MSHQKPTLFLALLAALAAPAFSATVTLTAAKDNTLFEDATGSLSNGAGEYLFAGKTNSNLIRRAVIAFDVAAGVPAGVQIIRTRLVLEMSVTIAGATTVQLRRLSADWGEGTSDAPGEEGTGVASTTGDATWIHRFWNTVNWTTAGGDFAGTASASRSVGGTGTYVWGSTAQMVTDVQGWLETPASNFGWLLLGDESTSPTAKRFNSRENTNTATVPMLEIGYLQALFDDGFESGDTSGWSSSFPP